MTSTIQPTSIGDALDPTTSTAERHPVREVATYVALVYAVGVVLALALPGTKANPGPVALLSALIPATIVGLVRLVARRRHGAANPHPIGVRHLGLRRWPAAIAIPVAAAGGSMVVAWLFHVVRFHGLGEQLANVPPNLLVMTVLFLGEEIGWRSYVLPRLQEAMPVRRAALVTGFIQGCFHLPLILLTAGYDGDGRRWIVAPMAVSVIGVGGVIFGWLRTTSGSLWPVTIAHAAVNLCFLEAPTLVTDHPAEAAYVTNEAGIVTFAFVALAAVWVWRRADWSSPKAR